LVGLTVLLISRALEVVQKTIQCSTTKLRVRIDTPCDLLLIQLGDSSQIDLDSLIFKGGPRLLFAAAGSSGGFVL
jgi:hypothetical protein